MKTTCIPTDSMLSGGQEEKFAETKNGHQMKAVIIWHCCFPLRKGGKYLFNMSGMVALVSGRMKTFVLDTGCKEFILLSNTEQRVHHLICMLEII